MHVPTPEKVLGEDRGGQSCPGPASSPREPQLCSQAQPHVIPARTYTKGLQSQGMTRVCLPHPLGAGAEAAWYWAFLPHSLLAASLPGGFQDLTCWDESLTGPQAGACPSHLQGLFNPSRPQEARPGWGASFGPFVPLKAAL